MRRTNLGFESVLGERIRIQLHAQWLKPIWGPIVLSANAEYGLANGYGGKSLPFIHAITLG